MKISIYAFIAMAHKTSHQITVLQLTNFDKFEAQNNDLEDHIDCSQFLKIISAIIAITLTNYNKSFIKIWKKPYIRNKLKQIVIFKYYNYLDV